MSMMSALTQDSLMVGGVVEVMLYKHKAYVCFTEYTHNSSNVGQITLCNILGSKGLHCSYLYEEVFLCLTERLICHLVKIIRTSYHILT